MSSRLSHGSALQNHAFTRLRQLSSQLFLFPTRIKANAHAIGNDVHTFRNVIHTQTQMMLTNKKSCLSARERQDYDSFATA